MPLDATPPAIDYAATLTAAFSRLGQGDTAPKLRTAQDKSSYEYWAASLLSRLAEARRERAKKAAVADRVLPNHAAEPMPIGTAETVFSGDFVTISVKVTEQSPRLNTAGFLADAEKLGIPPAKLKRLVKKHTQEFAGAHVFTASLVG